MSFVWCRVALRLPSLTPPESKNPAEAGFSKKLKLTDKPGSVVGQSFI